MKAAAKAARVPKLRFPGFEDEWPRQQLDAITSKKISYGIVQAGEHVPGGMPYIKSQDLNQPLDLDSLQRTSAEIARKYQRSEVEPGDIVFSLRGNIGVCQIVPASIPAANLTQGTARIAVADHDNRLVAQILQTLDIVRQIEACAKGSTFREISLEALRKITVAVSPTLPEQQKIAAFLTAVDGRIEQLSRKKALLEEYKKGVMQQLFTQNLRFQDDHGHDFSDWEEKTVGDVCSVVTSGSRDWAQYYSEEGAKFVRMTNLARNGIHLLLDDMKYVSLPQGGHEGARTSLQAHDILISITAELGKIGWVPEGFGEAYINQHTALVRPVRQIVDSKYLAYVLSTPDSHKRLNRLNDAGAKAGLNLATLREFELLVPSLPEQTKIAGFLSALDGKIAAVGEQMRQTQAWKKGLLQQLFV